MRVHPKLAGVGIALVSILVTSVFFIDFCGLAYQCGCDHLWAAGAARCNVHSPDMKHCPWCSIGLRGAGMVWLGMVVPQSFLAFAPARWSVMKRLLASLVAFPIIGGIEALAIGLAMGYWS